MPRNKILKCLMLCISYLISSTIKHFDQTIVYEPHSPMLPNCTRKHWLSLHMSLISIFPLKWEENNKVQVPWLLPPNWCRQWLQAIMTLQGREPTCAEAKSQLGEQQAGQKDDWGQEIEKIETGRWSHLGLTGSRLVVGQSNTERKLSEQGWPPEINHNNQA